MNTEQMVDKWIGDHVSPGNQKCEASSYGLRNLCEMHLGVDIPQVFFDSRMLKADLPPLNPDEKDLIFDVEYREKPERFGPAGSFYESLKKHKDRSGPVGEFVRDVMMDDNWPVREDNYLACRRYLRRHTSYDVLFEGLKLAWKEWKASESKDS